MSTSSTWDHHNPVHVIFGAGRLRELPAQVSGRVVIITTAGMTRRGVTERVAQLLGGDGATIYDRVASNPTVEDADDAIHVLRRERIDTIVALGGGSVVDVAKILSLFLADSSLDLRAALARGVGPDLEPRPLVAIPTTAGTGSEVTPFATLWDTSPPRKLSLAAPRMHPKVALLDPELALSLPWEATLGPGLDAYTQCFEAIWNRNATPVTTALAQRGLEVIPPALRHLAEDSASIDARSQMAEAALLSGLAISHTRTALAHSISYPITARLGVPHGLACALVLPAVLAFNLEADDGRLALVARRAGLATTEALEPAVTGLLNELGAHEAIRRYLPDPAVLRTLAPEMLTPGRADNNLRPPRDEDVEAILSASEAWIAGEAIAS